MTSVFRPPTPMPLSGGGAGGGSSIINNSSSVAINVDASTGKSAVQISTNNTAALTVDDSQYVIIGNKTGIVPTKRLTVVDPSGQGIQIINSLAACATSLTTNSGGGLSIATSGSHVQFGSNNLYTTLGSLYIDSVPVVSTAEQLNYTATLKGIAEPSKALIVDDGRSITNINSLSALVLTGIIQTASQPNIKYLSTVDITNLSIGGEVVVSTATEINCLASVVQGIAKQSGAVVLDAQKNITGINAVSANAFTGTLMTAAQPNITTIGTLETLSVRQRIGIGTTDPTTSLDIVADSPTIRLSNRTFNATLMVDSLGNLRLSPDANISIKSHANVVFTGTSEIIGLNKLSSVSIAGLLTTPEQPNITTIGALSSLDVGGNVVFGSFDSLSQRRLVIKEPEGRCIRMCQSESIGCDININSGGDLVLVPYRDLRLTGGKAIRMSGQITGVTDLVATTLSGLLLDGVQPNITSIGTLSSLTVSNGIEAASVVASSLTGTLITGPQPNITQIGTLSSLAVTNWLTAGSLTSNSITGTILTSTQPNITSVGTLIGLNVSNGITCGSLAADTLSGVLLTANQPNITSIGTLSNLNVSREITTSSLISSTITGQIQTAYQPNITSVGTLTSLAVTNGIIASTLNVAEISGKLLSPNQSNITTIGTLTSLTVIDSITANSLTVDTIAGTLLTSAQPNITAIGTLTRLHLNGMLGIGVEGPSSAIDINTSNLSAAAAIKLNNGTATASFSIGPHGAQIDTSGAFLTLGGGVGLQLSGGTIVGLSSLTVSELTTTIMTPSQPNITRVGTLPYLDTGFLGVGIAHSDVYGLNLFSEAGRIAMISDGARSMSIFVANGDYTIGTSNNRLALGQDVSLVLNGGTVIGLDTLTANNISGIITTSAQPNITSVGALTALTVNGPVAGGSAAFDSVVVDGDITVHGSLNLSTPLSFTSLSSSNATFDSNLPAVSLVDGGTLTIVGGASFSRNVIIGESLQIGNVTLTENSFAGMVSGAPGVVEANKTIVADSLNNLAGFNDLTATNVFGSISTAYQPNITTIGNLSNLNINGYLGLGTTSPMKQLEINSTSGDCMRLSYNKGDATSYVDFLVDEFGSGSIITSGPTLTIKNRILADKITLGNTTNSIMPLELGWVPFTMTQPYAYSTSSNGRGLVNPASSGYVSYNYSIRASGRILCTQSLDVMSDKRTKKNVTQLTDEYCTSFIERTTPVSFNWISGDGNKSFGYIAQELVRTGFDELVNLAYDPSVEEVIDDDGFINPKGVKFTISYQHIIPILAKNQKRLMQENQDLKAKLDAILKMLQSMNKIESNQ